MAQPRTVNRPVLSGHAGVASECAGVSQLHGVDLAVRHQTLAGRPETRRGSAELSGLPLSVMGLDDWPVYRSGAEGGQAVAVQGVDLH